MIHLDTDLGGDIDDLCALALLLARPDVEITGITTADRFFVRGQEIYLHLPRGLGESQLTDESFDSRLATTSTIRNWRTVIRLLDLVGG